LGVGRSTLGTPRWLFRLAINGLVGLTLALGPAKQSFRLLAFALI